MNAVITCNLCKLPIIQPDDIFTLTVSRINLENPNQPHSCISVTELAFHHNCLPTIIHSCTTIPVICDCKHNQPIVDNQNNNNNNNPIDTDPAYPIIHGGRNTYRSIPTISPYVHQPILKVKKN
jgi:hypothetical protein